MENFHSQEKKKSLSLTYKELDEFHENACLDLSLIECKVCNDTHLGEMYAGIAWFKCQGLTVMHSVKAQVVV